MFLLQLHPLKLLTVIQIQILIQQAMFLLKLQPHKEFTLLQKDIQPALFQLNHIKVIIPLIIIKQIIILIMAHQITSKLLQMEIIFQIFLKEIPIVDIKPLIKRMFQIILSQPLVNIQ